MPGFPAFHGGGGHAQSPFAPLGQPGPEHFGAPTGGLPGAPTGIPVNPLGGGQAMNPNMWARSGTLNPRKMGAPTTQGGFDVNALLPPNLRQSPFSGGS